VVHNNLLCIGDLRK